jgi:hypothetical protein
MANSQVKWFRNFLTLIVLFLLIYIYNDADCEGDDCATKDLPSFSQNKQVVPEETMHIMTVSCGRPNYQVFLQNLNKTYFFKFLFCCKIKAKN